ncbi:hypothetical protein [Actinokineospora sp.]|uniref:hypothetical protein n=1 Tax=Actinokineospora sp. TaxID=1872133 RepID=UPI0040383F0E
MEAEQVGDHDRRQFADRFDHRGVPGGEGWQSVLPQEVLYRPSASRLARPTARQQIPGLGDVLLDQCRQLGWQQDRVLAEGEEPVAVVASARQTCLS